jgi:hypothetical protein
MTGNRRPDVAACGDDELVALVRDAERAIPEFIIICRALDALAELRRRRQQVAAGLDCPPEITAAAMAGHPEPDLVTPAEFERRCRARLAARRPSTLALLAAASGLPALACAFE